MIELTQEQMRALTGPVAQPRVVNPQTREEFILVPVAEYQRLTKEAYDDGLWTDEERDLLREEACEMLDSYGKDK